MTDDIPQMSMSEAPKGGIPLALVWVIPLVAVGIALFIAWQTYAQRGPLIEVAFEDTSGVIAGQTEVKFRSLTVGLVEELSFGEDLANVVAHIRLDKAIASFVDESAQFWIVQPEVSARGVTGLDTVLSGSYIQGSWDNDPGEPKNSFVGLEAAPLAPSDQEGLLIVLRSEQGGRVHSGAPIVYRGVTVGEIDEPKLSLDGSGVTANAFIKSPYDQLVNSNTRFWGAGGISLDIGTSGVNLNVANLASIIQGGTTFETIAPGGVAIENGHIFQVYGDKATAEKSLLDEVNIEELTYSAVFSGAIGGLSAGASVVFGGVTVGQVTDLGAFISPSTDGTNEVKLRVDFVLQPRHLGLTNDPEGQSLRDFMIASIKDGLFARLSNESLISSTLHLELVQITDREPGELDLEGRPYPIVPSLPVELADLSASAEGIVDRIAALPIEALMDNAVNILASANQLINSAGVREAPRSAVALMDEARATVAAFDPDPLMAELQATAQDLRTLVADVGSDANRALVASSLTQLDALLAELEESAEILPDLMTSAQSVTDKAAALDLAAVVEQTTQTIAEINAIVAAPASQALSSEIQALIAETREVIGSEALQSAPRDVTEAIESLQNILDTVENSEGLSSLLASLERLDDIAASVETAANGLPELRAQVADILTKVEALEIEPLLASATATANSIDALASDPEMQSLPGDVKTLVTQTGSVVGSEAVQALPSDLAETLARVDRLLAQVEESNGIASLMAALNRLDTIAASIETTTDKLPDLQEQIASVVAKAETIPLDSVIASTEELLQSANTFMGSKDTAAVPASLTAALDEVTAVLSDLRAGGTVENVNATLASAAEAAEALEAAAESLPDLTARLNSLVADAEALMAAYGSRSAFNSQTLSALHDIRAAARAVTDLSRAIERNPSSLIRGR